MGVLSEIGELGYDIGEALPELCSTVMAPVMALTGLSLYDKGNYGLAALSIAASVYFSGIIYKGILRGYYFKRIGRGDIDPLKIIYSKIKNLVKR